MELDHEQQSISPYPMQASVGLEVPRRNRIVCTMIEAF
jgi:hypothetical protein